MLTPSTVRFDLKGKKCGRGYIPANEKCRQGADKKKKQKRSKKLNPTVSKVGEVAANLGSIALLSKGLNESIDAIQKVQEGNPHWKSDLGRSTRSIALAAAARNISAAGTASRTGKKKKAAGLGLTAGLLAGYGLSAREGTRKRSVDDPIMRFAYTLGKDAHSARKALNENKFYKSAKNLLRGRRNRGGGLSKRGDNMESSRLDLRGKKCGNSYIPAKAICRQGSNIGLTAEERDNERIIKRAKEKRQRAVERRIARGKSTKGIGNKLKIAGETAANLGSIALTYQGAHQALTGLTSGKPLLASGGLRNVGLASSIGSLTAASKAARRGQKKREKEFLKTGASLGAFAIGQNVAINASEGFKRVGGFETINFKNASRNARRAYNKAWVRAGGMKYAPSDGGEYKRSKKRDRPKRPKQSPPWDDPSSAWTTKARKIDSIWTPGF